MRALVVHRMQEIEPEDERGPEGNHAAVVGFLEYLECLQRQPWLNLDLHGICQILQLAGHAADLR